MGQLFGSFSYNDWMNLRGFFYQNFRFGFILHRKDQNKVGLAISFIENTEIRYGWGFIL